MDDDEEHDEISETELDLEQPFEPWFGRWRNDRATAEFLWEVTRPSALTQLDTGRW